MHAETHKLVSNCSNTFSSSSRDCFKHGIFRLHMHLEFATSTQGKLFFGHRCRYRFLQSSFEFVASCALNKRIHTDVSILSAQEFFGGNQINEVGYSSTIIADQRQTSENRFSCDGVNGRKIETSMSSLVETSTRLVFFRCLQPGCKASTTCKRQAALMCISDNLHPPCSRNSTDIIKSAPSIVSISCLALVELYDFYRIASILKKKSGSIYLG